MNIANVTDRFALVSGIDKGEIYKWRALIDDACNYVTSIVIKNNLDKNDKTRIEMLCAIYAFKLYSLCADENFTSFSAGDVHFTSPAESVSKADKLWNEYCLKSSDLINCKGFLFGRVM